MNCLCFVCHVPLWRLLLRSFSSPFRLVSQEYLKEEGGLSAEAVIMIGELLNEQSLMHLALTEMLYIESDVNDKTR